MVIFNLVIGVLNTCLGIINCVLLLGLFSLINENCENEDKNKEIPEYILKTMYS